MEARSHSKGVCPRRPPRGGKAIPVRHAPLPVVLFLLCLPLFLLPAHAHGENAAGDEVTILVLYSAPGKMYEAVDLAMQGRLREICKERAAPCPRTKWLRMTLKDDEDALKEAVSKRPKLIITLGVKAASWIADHPTDTPVLFTLIPSLTYRGMVSHLPLGFPGMAIYIDQPLPRQFRLIKHALSRAKEVAVLLGPVSVQQKAELIATAKRFGYTLNLAILQKEENIGRMLKQVLDQSDVLLSLPDPLVYNRHTIFSILLTTYHQQIPVVGFSRAYVKSGALMAVYSSPKQVGRHTAEVAAEVLSGDVLLPRACEYPRYFSVAINHSVARSLDLHLPSEEELLSLLRREEDEDGI